jgi:SAM-dependent methyltransferase
MSDTKTAEAFATSWNHVGSVYTREQYLDWIAPLTPDDIRGHEVLELGFGNGSLLAHTGALAPRRLAGVELGDTIEQTRRNLRHLPAGMLELRQGDLTTVDAGLFDVVYCIGVLHHLQSPLAGFDAVLRHTKPGGRFHCWVYAWEGNALVRLVVEPVRRVASRLPWWLTKYGIALPLVTPYFFWARFLSLVPRVARKMPLGEYTLWIARERFGFFHHVAFDQLVTPQTAYLRREELEAWLRDPRVEEGSAYVIQRNGNSWKFGGRRTSA